MESIEEPLRALRHLHHCRAEEFQPLGNMTDCIPVRIVTGKLQVLEFIVEPNEPINILSEFKIKSVRSMNCTVDTG